MFREFAVEEETNPPLWSPLLYVSIVLCVLGFTLNVMNLLTWRSLKAKVFYPSAFLYKLLSVADCVILVTFCPANFDVFQNDVAQSVFRFVCYGHLDAGIYIILMLAIVRYIGMFYPFQSRNWLSAFRVKLVIGVLCVMCLLVEALVWNNDMFTNVATGEYILLILNKGIGVMAPGILQNFIMLTVVYNLWRISTSAKHEYTFIPLPKKLEAAPDLSDVIPEMRHLSRKNPKGFHMRLLEQSKLRAKSKLPQMTTVSHVEIFPTKERESPGQPPLDTGQGERSGEAGKALPKQEKSEPERSLSELAKTQSQQQQGKPAPQTPAPQKGKEDSGQHTVQIEQLQQSQGMSTSQTMQHSLDLQNTSQTMQRSQDSVRQQQQRQQHPAEHSLSQSTEIKTKTKQGPGEESEPNARTKIEVPVQETSAAPQKSVSFKTMFDTLTQPQTSKTDTTQPQPGTQPDKNTPAFKESKTDYEPPEQTTKPEPSHADLPGIRKHYGSMSAAQRNIVMRKPSHYQYLPKSYTHVDCRSVMVVFAICLTTLIAYPICQIVIIVYYRIYSKFKVTHNIFVILSVLNSAVRGSVCLWLPPFRKAFVTRFWKCKRLPHRVVTSESDEEWNDDSSSLQGSFTEI